MTGSWWRECAALARIFDEYASAALALPGVEGATGDALTARLEGLPLYEARRLAETWLDTLQWRLAAGGAVILPEARFDDAGRPEEAPFWLWDGYRLRRVVEGVTLPTARDFDAVDIARRPGWMPARIDDPTAWPWQLDSDGSQVLDLPGPVEVRARCWPVYRQGEDVVVSWKFHVHAAGQPGKLHAGEAATSEDALRGAISAAVQAYWRAA